MVRQAGAIHTGCFTIIGNQNFLWYYPYILIFIFVLNDLDYIKSCASIEVCRQIVIAFDSTAMGRITFENFKDLMCSLKVWHNVFKNWTKVSFFLCILSRNKVKNQFYTQIMLNFSLNNKCLNYRS